MTLAAAIERYAYLPVRRQLDRGAHAQNMLRNIRESTPIHDPIHGFIPDRRPLPSAWAMRLALVLLPVERKLQRFVEVTLPAEADRRLGGRVDEEFIGRQKDAAETAFRTGGRMPLFR